MLTAEFVVIIAMLTQGNSAINLIVNADEEGGRRSKDVIFIKHACFTSWYIQS